MSQTIIIAYFNKTGVNYPFKTVTTERFHQEMLLFKSIYIKEFYNENIDILKSIEKVLYKHSNKYGLITINTYEKTRIELGYDSISSMMLLWIGIVYSYEKNGLLDCNNDINGIVIKEYKNINIFDKLKNHYDEIHMNLKVCQICQVKGNFKCLLCSQNYCCRDHQKQDWKSHKKICQPKRKYIEYKN